MTVKNYFEQALILQEKCGQQALACHLMEKDAENISGAGFDAHYGSGLKQAPYVSKVEKLEKGRVKLKNLEGQLDALRAQMDVIIEQVDRVDWQALLRCLYIQGMTVKECSDILHVSKSTVWKYVRYAMEKITLPPEAINLHLPPRSM